MPAKVQDLAGDEDDIVNPARFLEMRVVSRPWWGHILLPIHFAHLEPPEKDMQMWRTRNVAVTAVLNLHTSEPSEEKKDVTGGNPVPAQVSRRSAPLAEYRPPSAHPWQHVFTQVRIKVAGVAAPDPPFAEVFDHLTEGMTLNGKVLVCCARRPGDGQGEHRPIWHDGTRYAARRGIKSFAAEDDFHQKHARVSIFVSGDHVRRARRPPFEPPCWPTLSSCPPFSLSSTCNAVRRITSLSAPLCTVAAHTVR